MSTNALLDSLRAAVAAAPHDVPLRLHLGSVLLGAGHREEAVRQAATVLSEHPGDGEALALLTAASAPAGTPAPAPPSAQPVDPAPAPRAPGPDDADADDVVRRWSAELAGDARTRYVEGDDGVLDVQAAGLRLADVAGMDEVKARLEAGFLAPMRNPELARAYGATMRGGMLMYGPPGCGKTFIARAVAGELGAAFIPVALSDVLDMYVGGSERNVHELFETARASAPCVVFLDEVDALGGRRSQQGAATRGSVNQLLTEMDGVGSRNDGVFVLGATNAPWDVDVALRRPGRFDRMLLVMPPDETARQAVLRHHLRALPVGDVDLARLAAATDGFSGADLAHLCSTAAERALMDSARTGTARLIVTEDLRAALREVRASTGPWLESARNVAQFANEGGAYDDLVRHLRRRKLM